MNNQNGDFNLIPDSLLYSLMKENLCNFFNLSIKEVNISYFNVISKNLKKLSGQLLSIHLESMKVSKYKHFEHTTNDFAKNRQFDYLKAYTSNFLVKNR